MAEQVLTMEHPATIHDLERVSTNLKSILLHVQNDAGLQRRVQTSLAIARATGAHLHCVQVTPVEAYVTMASFGGMYALDRWINKINAEEERLRSELEAHLHQEDVTWDYEQIVGYTATELTRRSALADLVITGREAHLARAQRPELPLLGELITQIRTPMLLRGNADQELDLFGAAVIAWDGSYEAANAARIAVDLLKLASDVRIVRYEEEKETKFPDTRLIEFLSEHDIHAELDVRTVGVDFASDLVEYACAREASYVVMGGYSHSRAGEFLFGGVTRELLRDCPISLVISH